MNIVIYHDYIRTLLSAFSQESKTNLKKRTVQNVYTFHHIKHICTTDTHFIWEQTSVMIYYVMHCQYSSSPISLKDPVSNGLKHTEAEIKWLPFCRQHFDSGFFLMKFMVFWFKFLCNLFIDTPINPHWLRKLLNRWQAIIRTRPCVRMHGCMYLSLSLAELTHWGRVTHICVSNLTIIGSDNGLSPGRRQAIIWTNAGILLIGALQTHFSEILIKIITFSFNKKRLKVSSAKWRPFCLDLNVLTTHDVLLDPYQQCTE